MLVKELVYEISFSAEINLFQTNTAVNVVTLLGSTKTSLLIKPTNQSS